MLFNSLEFLIYLPVVVGLFYALPHRFRWALLLAASYFFYCWWSVPYGLLLLAVSFLDWGVALLVQDAVGTAAKRRWLVLSIVGNVGLLFVFKYYNLVNDALRSVVTVWPLPHSTLILPIGISFHTFQSMSYTIDVYRGKFKAERRPGMFLLFVAYFPQLVAGPVERAGRLLPQLSRPVTFDWDRAVSGLRLAAWGMFKKVVVADRLAEVVNIVYGDPTSFPASAHLLATFFFAYQVYCDFSGYSDIARGVARILGVDLMVNFDQPYLSRTYAELWSKWHISMTTWFRDYVYLPLGGSHVSTLRWAFNVLLIFVLSGMWHGAKWSLISWGALSALILIAEKLTAPARATFQRAIGLDRTPRVQAVVQWATMFAFWLFTLPFFRGDSLGDALYMVGHVGSAWGFTNEVLYRLHLDGPLLCYSFALCPFVELVDRAIRTPSLVARVDAWPTLPRWLLDWALLLSILVLGSFGDMPFVYFQF